ncbi:cAMP-binding domain of CRP or a regulatory subunit of cAMP-dependent protein kinases [Algoriphagus faecimaris]|uniref:cAMP-binding domain of CRP or a regulatory subunit of cAMP-dependent protein kinases n=1 Tax=Algoriphagus faecimaris TaxID=686796 RepID=A0A1G6NBL0_9BACT|nr:Crp/Fnr family transcriptional regulator [Algoriphagus faecimaris]SDC64797.1 cAMP-binding domain of CRP or a regulatory subunit of cAMP-dependent protein kinases [Algoriphagus faecimaris]
MIPELLWQSLEKHIVLSDYEKSLILSKLSTRKYKKGQFLVFAGGKSNVTNFVLEGSVMAYFTDDKGKDHIIQFAFEGWWISDLKSFITQGEAIFNVQALEESTVLELSYEVLEELYSIIPQLERFFRIVTQRAFVSFQERILETNSQSGEDRYRAFHEKFKKYETRIPQKLIASYLGVTPEFFSRMKKKMDW